MKSESTIPVRVYWALGAGMLAISFSPILVRLAASAPGPTLAFWRTVLAALFLLPLAARTAWSDWRKHTRSSQFLTVVAGFLLGLHFIAWIESLYHTSVASASILFTTNPLFIAGIGYLVLNERLSRPTIVAIVVSVFGAALIGWGDTTDIQFPSALKGNSLALSAAILFAIYLLISRATRQTSDWLAYVFPLYTVVAVTVAAYVAITKVEVFAVGWDIYVLCALMALGPQIMGHGSLNYAVRFIPAAILGLLGLVEPVLATLWAWLLFGEVPSLITALGMAIVLGALLLVYWPSRNLSPGSAENVRRPRTK